MKTQTVILLFLLSTFLFLRVNGACSENSQCGGNGFCEIDAEDGNVCVCDRGFLADSNCTLNISDVESDSFLAHVIIFATLAWILFIFAIVALGFSLAEPSISIALKTKTMKIMVLSWCAAGTLIRALYLSVDPYGSNLILGPIGVEFWYGFPIASLVIILVLIILFWAELYSSSTQEVLFLVKYKYLFWIIMLSIVLFEFAIRIIIGLRVPGVGGLRTAYNAYLALVGLVSAIFYLFYGSRMMKRLKKSAVKNTRAMKKITSLIYGTCVLAIMVIVTAVVETALSIGEEGSALDVIVIESIFRVIEYGVFACMTYALFPFREIGDKLPWVEQNVPGFHSANRSSKSGKSALSSMNVSQTNTNSGKE